MVLQYSTDCHIWKEGLRICIHAFGYFLLSLTIPCFVILAPTGFTLVTSPFCWTSIWAYGLHPGKQLPHVNFLSRIQPSLFGPSHSSTVVKHEPFIHWHFSIRFLFFFSFLVFFLFFYCLYSLVLGSQPTAFRWNQTSKRLDPLIHETPTSSHTKHDKPESNQIKL